MIFLTYFLLIQVSVCRRKEEIKEDNLLLLSCLAIASRERWHASIGGGGGGNALSLLIPFSWEEGNLVKAAARTKAYEGMPLLNTARSRGSEREGGVLAPFLLESHA